MGEKEQMKKEWKLEEQLNDKEIDEIIEQELSVATALVEQKRMEADIYIGYLRKEADRLEHQLELLEKRLKDKANSDWVARIMKNTGKKRTNIINSKKHQANLSRMSNPARKRLLIDRNKN